MKGSQKQQLASGLELPKLETKDKIKWLHEQPWQPVADVLLNPHDGGKVRRLVHPDTNNWPDVEFCLGLYRLEPGDRHPLHYHPNGWEFYYVAAGEGEFQIDDEIVQGAPGLALYMPKGTRHSIEVKSDKPMDVIYGFAPARWQDLGLIWVE